MLRQLGLALGLVLVAAQSAVAQVGATDDVVTYLNGLQSLSARFTQIRYGEQGELLEQSNGSCDIERPGRFRWQYAAPYEQLIVSDGSRIQIYDPDLEQVTVSAIPESGVASPAALLGRAADIRVHFDITDRGMVGELHWFGLVPREGGDPSFSAIELAWRGAQIARMRLTDNLGQLTEIEFEAVSLNQPLDSSRFDFSPPAGVDIIDAGTH